MIHHSIWNDVCQQPTLAATYGHYGTLVSDSTTKLQQCVQETLTVLNDRAIGLMRCANFDAALRDAAAMQELAPLSALGYLCAANIYSQQGRQQAVIRICNKALSVVHNRDPDYIKLQRAKVHAKQRAAIRLDIISRLPLDVVVHVLFPMIMDHEELLDSIKLGPYLNVSKAWRDFVVQTSGGLHFKLNGENRVSQVHRFARYTRSLHLPFYRHGNWLSDLLSSGKLCSLKEIKIERLGRAIDVDHLVSSLQSVSNTLTHFSIQDSFSERIAEFPNWSSPIQPFHIATILINCPNLIFLDIDHEYNADFSTVPTTITWPRLTTLRLCNDEIDISNDIFLGILKRFPSLKELTLQACTGIQPMVMIQRYCPSLRDLKITTTDTISSSGQFEQQQQQEQHHDQRIEGGLETLALMDRSNNNSDPMEICHMLKQHHRTLVHLDLSSDYADDNDVDIYDLEYPCLKTLGLACSSKGNACFGWWILEKAPLLEELGTATFAIGSSPILRGIRPPRSLRKLALNLYGAHELDDPEVADVFLDQFAQYGELKELSLILNSSVDTSSTLAVVCRFQKLEHLVLFFNPDWCSRDMEWFLDMLVQGCPLLKSLEMRCKTTPSPYAIRKIKQLVHLEHIAFAVNDTTEYSILLTALVTLPKLKSVKIYQDNSLAREFVKQLTKLRRHIKFVIG